MTPQRSHSFSRPTIATPGQQAVAIESPGDPFIRTDPRERSHDIDDLFRCLIAILSTPPPGQAQLRVHAPFPVKDKNEFTRLGVHIHHNLVDQRSNDAFFQANIGLLTIPHRTLPVSGWSFSLDPGGAARFALRSLAPVARLGSNVALTHRLLAGFPDPPHRTASGHAAPHSVPLPVLVPKLARPRPAYALLLRLPLSPLPLPQVAPRAAPLCRSFRLPPFHRTQYSVVLHCPTSLDDTHNGADHGGCPCTTRPAYDHTVDSATDQTAKRHRLAPCRMIRARERSPQLLAEFADAAPSSRSPHACSESMPATAPSVCVVRLAEARPFHSATCVLFFHTHRHRRKSGWSECGRPSRRWGASTRSRRPACTREVVSRAPGTTTRSDEQYPVRETCETPTGRLVALDGRGLSPNVVLRSLGNRLVRSPAAHLAEPFPAGLRASAGATSPVHIRSNCLSDPTAVDHCFAGAYRRSPDRLKPYQQHDTPLPTVAIPGCCVRSETPPELLPLPPCPNKLLLPCVRSRRARLYRLPTDPDLHPRLRSRASPAVASVVAWHTATSDSPNCG